MSYDLFLFRRKNANPLKKKEFQSYFKKQPHFTVKGTNAGYENEKTGVYFNFTFDDGGNDEESLTDPHIHCNINYFRSHVFGLEAERVLTTLVEELDLIVEDPQNDGMGEGEYTPEGFLRGWNAGNRFGYQACLSLEQEGENLVGQQHVLPAEKLRKSWEWTYYIDHLYEEVHDDDIDVFIPQVMYVLCDGVLQTLCVWPQLIPTALPEVDRVLILRDELPEELADGINTDNALATWQQVRKAASKFKLISRKETPTLKYVMMDYGTADDAPKELVNFLRKLPAFDGTLEGVPFDQILDEELVQECKPKPKKGKKKK